MAAGAGGAGLRLTEGRVGETDPYISAYVFFGLLRARTIGITVDETALQRAGTYLSGLKPAITNDTNGAKLDEITFIQFALAQARLLMKRRSANFMRRATA